MYARVPSFARSLYSLWSQVRVNNSFTQKGHLIPSFSIDRLAYEALRRAGHPVFAECEDELEVLTWLNVVQGWHNAPETHPSNVKPGA